MTDWSDIASIKPLPPTQYPHSQPPTAAARLLEIEALGSDPERRTLYLGDIEEECGLWVPLYFDFLNAQSSAPIRVVLNTPGGDVTAMFAIHDSIRRSSAPVHVVGTGQVASAGVLILACGHKRLVTESCCLMSHEPTFGDADLGLRAAKGRRRWEDWTHSFWCELMARYTPGKDAKWWAKNTEKNAEYWLLGGKAIVEAGLADEVA